MVNFTPQMPGVTATEDISEVFERAREMANAGSGRQVVVVTPERRIVGLPCPPPGSASEQMVKSLQQLAAAQQPIKVSMIAYTDLDALRTDRKRAIPSLGYVLGLAYLGHNVVVFEGHPGAMMAACSDADLLLVDEGMVPHLAPNWLGLAVQAMNRPRIMQLNRDRSIKELLPSKSAPPPASKTGTGPIQRLKSRPPARDRAPAKATPPPPPAPPIDVAPIQRDMENGDFDAALARLNAGIQTNPEQAQLWHWRGTVRCLLGDMAGGVADLDEACVIDPNTPDPFYDRAEVNVRLGRLEDAISDYNHIANLDPNNPRPFSLRGLLMLEQYEDGPQAIDDFSEAVKRAPDNPDYVMQRGMALASMHTYGPAIDDFNRAIEIDPQLARAYYERGLVYQRVEESKKALADFMQALEIEPDNTQVLLTVGKLHDEAGEISDALDVYVRYLEAAAEDDPQAQEIRERVTYLDQFENSRRRKRRRSR
ncbi:MAG: tetratricopeptide repeat protein [Chloroflexi bacterium]|nr:tetratricopeptide repeat protein [Chloroflexota bacterium]